MQTKSAGKSTMNAAALTEDVRIAAKELVRRREYDTGSRMRAYEDIAGSIGTSAGWLRGFIKGYGDVSLSFVVGMNITTLYGRLCERAEWKALNLERSNEAMARDLKAMESKMPATRPAPDVESS